MTKRILAAIMMLCLVCASFAQTAPKKILSAKDVDAFIANHAAIETDLEALGDKYDKYFDIPGVNPAPNQGGAVPDMAAEINALRATKVPAEVQSIMQKHGMGDNGFEKYIVISYGFGALYLEKMLKMQSASQAQTPEMKPYMDQAQQRVAQMKATVNSSDLALVSARLDDLAATFDEQGD
jgi:hypothetical protein